MKIHFKPEKFLLPGLFLFILGFGNIAVGAYRSQQYHGVVEELDHLDQAEDFTSASPLRRMQLSKETSDRLYLRQHMAKAKRDLYQFVIFGGEIFLGFSLILLLIGLILKMQQRKDEALA